MICPACKAQLSQKIENGIELDICLNGCGGIWFDDKELGKLQQDQNSISHETLFAGRNQNNTIIDHSKERNCPKCPSEKLDRVFHYEDKNLEIDICPACNGAWLDSGELFSLIGDNKAKDMRDKVFSQYDESSKGSAKVKSILSLIFK